MKWLAAAPKLLGLAAPSFARWVAAIGGALGERLSASQRAHFEFLFKRAPLDAACRELWLAIGRRGGKDFVAARLAIYLALFRKWTLAPGEVGVVIVLAVDRAQARVAFKYLRGALESNPLLWAEVENVTADLITLRNGIEIQVATSDYAAVRGRTIVAALLDEYAFWPQEQGTEVVRALRPAQATQPQSMIIVFSSVYASHGPFYEARRKHHGGSDPRVLFGVASTRDMNPTVSEDFIKGELERDYAGASAEYLSIERTDVSNFLDAALIDAAERASPREIPHALVSSDGGRHFYRAGLDVSGGRGDAAVCSIARAERDRVNVVALRRWPSPHDPLKVAREVAAFLASYGITSVIADQYAAEFAISAYREAGVTLMSAAVTRTEAYLHLLPLFTTGRIEIPADPVLRAELLDLERRTTSTGRDVIDHPPHGHDDCANALALAAYVTKPQTNLTPQQTVALTKRGMVPCESADIDDPTFRYTKQRWLDQQF